MVNKRVMSDYSEKSRFMPEDLLLEIFNRLPVKPLGRMLCVCKSWNSVISNPTFIAHHLHQSSSIPATQKSYLALRRYGKIDSYAFYRPDQGAPSLENCRKWFDRLPFKKFPFQSRHHHSPPNPLIYIDVIHGVVCLTSDPSSSAIILWNPTIRKYVEIPDSPFKCQYSDQYVQALGFGFHNCKHEFRLIRLYMPIQLLQPGPECHVMRLGYQVFSPQDGVWKKAVAATRIRPGKVISEASFFMNGTIHWFVSAYKVRKEKKRRKHNREYYRLLMFDCEREEFTEMVLPRAFNRTRYEGDSFPAKIFKCRGMLAIFMFISSNLELWVMEEYGVSSTWKTLSWREGEHELGGFVSEESMFLMDVKKQAVCYTEKHDNDYGWSTMRLVEARTSCEYIILI